MDGAQKDSAQHIIRELREIKNGGTLNREEIARRVDAIHEKLQLAIEDGVVSDEDVKQMVRNCLRPGAKTFNEIQKETKISPQALAKYLRMMKGEVEEFNGVYRIIYSSSIVYVGKGALGTDETAITEIVGPDDFTAEP
jgi:uncharacterized protein YfkK (UPF0435 family)